MNLKHILSISKLFFIVFLISFIVTIGFSMPICAAEDDITNDNEYTSETSSESDNQSVDETTDSTNLKEKKDSTEGSTVKSVTSTTLASTTTYASQDMTLPDVSAEDGKSFVSVPVLDSINNTGAVVLKIPIAVPPGRKGIEPSLSLVYNSYQKNGWVGLGWNLDMGAIQRSTKKGIQYNVDDYVLVTNGVVEELVQRSDWGADYYGRKIEESFSKFYYSSGGWEVTTKDGTKYFYGTSASSRQENAKGTFKWCLDRVEDTNGNFMTLTYTTKEDDQIYLETIAYTGNGGDAPTSEIYFYLQARPDTMTFGDGARIVQTDYRLKTIDIWAGGQRAGAYKLTYAQSNYTVESMLSHIQQFGSDAILDGSNTITGGTALPSINISMNDGQISLTPSTWTDNVDYTYEFTQGDYNGDGKTDLMRYYCHKELGIDGFSLYDTITFYHYIYLGNGDGTFSSVINFSNSFQSSLGSTMDENTQFVLIQGDYNGDGKTDLMWNQEGAPFSNYYHFVYIGNGNGTFNRYIWSESVSGECSYNSTQGDYNGDGKTDLCWYRPYHGRHYVYLSNGNGTFAPYVMTTGSYNYYEYTRTQGDYNGDGKTDFAWYKADTNQHYVYLSNGDGTFTSRISWTDSINYESMYYYHVQGDYNGDGKTDFAWYSANNYRKTYLSNGDGTFASCISWSDGTWYNGDIYGQGDYNGDGKTDFIWYDTDSYYFYLSKGDGTFQKVARGDSTDHYGETSIQGDYNGDGKTDLLWWGRKTDDYDPPFTYYIKYSVYLVQPAFKKLQLTSFANGAGATTTMAYSLANRTVNPNLPLILYPVSSVTVNDGNGVQSTTSYAQSVGIFDYPTREFRGFYKVTQTNPDATISNSWYHQDEYRKTRAYESRLSTPGGGTMLSKETLTWATVTLNYPYNNCAFVKLTENQKEIYTGETAMTRENYTYDDTNGNLLTTVASGTNTGSGYETITTANVYGNYGNWVWRITQATVSGSTSGQVRQTDYEYENVTGNMLYKDQWLSGGINPQVAMTYDTYGNMETFTDARGNTTTIEYESAAHTYPSRIIRPMTNGVSHITEFPVYDYRFGKKTKSQDENGNITSYTYDCFGRLIQTDYPDGGQTTTEYYDYDSPRYTITRVSEGGGSTIDTHEYYDGLSRLIQSITFGENDKSVVTRIYYDTMGRRYLERGPFFGPGVGYPQSLPSQYPQVRTIFDYLGRPVTIQTLDGTYGTVSTTYSYSGFNTTVTDPDSCQKTEHKDYRGRIIRITEHASQDQQTDYTYNAAGDLLSVTDDHGNVSIINYDTLGRKINMTDPDLGYWLFTYDPSGNLLTQTDAKGQIITFTYDELNRVTQKTYSTSEPTVIYTYDNTAIPNGIGRLFSVKTDTSASVKAYTTQYEYDCSGKMTAVVYPDTYELTYTYHPGSSLINTVIGSDSYTYAVYSVYEPTGKVGQIDHGNGTATAYTYDALSTRLTDITTSDSSGLSENDIQRRAYLYSQGGDITAIVDDLRNITYNYTYDSLHRLISETNTGQYDAVSYTYDAIGNITSRTVGSSYFNYTAYDPSHKHAVKTINVNNVNYDFTYDDNGNMTGGPAITKSGYATMRTITYNTDNMPTQIHHGSTTVTVAYDPTGKRTKKAVYGGSTTYYVNQYFEEKNGGGIKYIFAGNLRIAKVSSSSMYFFHKDHLGSSVGMSNASGTKAESTDYMPFGEERDHSGSTVTDYKFTDQELDSESGLYNYDARLYDPGIGRFISADSIVPDMYDPQSLNRYSYCRNNPLIYVDPSGHSWAGFASETCAYAGGVSLAVAAYSGNPYAWGTTIGLFGLSAVFKTVDVAIESQKAFDKERELTQPLKDQMKKNEDLINKLHDNFFNNDKDKDKDKDNANTDTPSTDANDDDDGEDENAGGGNGEGRNAGGGDSEGDDGEDEE